MTHRTSPGGTFEIDRRYSVGRIRRASGTRSPKLFAKLLLMLEELEAKPTYLQAIRDGRMSVLDVWGAYQRYGLSRLPSFDAGRPLEATLDAWLARAELAGPSRRSYRSHTRRLLALAPRNATVGDVARLVAKYRDQAPAVTFNRTRAVMRSFVAKGLGLGHYDELYREVSAVRPKRESPRGGHPQTPEQARAIAEALGRYGGMWWTLCTTGMSGGVEGPYFRDRFTVALDRIEIHGTKRPGRERIVPRLATPIRALCPYKAFRKLLAAEGVTPNDGRRTYEAWLEGAGIPKARRRRYLGHGVEDMTDLYGDGYPLDEFLAGDAERVLAYIGRPFAVQLEVMR
jgi:hypothetical protein